MIESVFLIKFIYVIIVNILGNVCSSDMACNHSLLYSFELDLLWDEFFPMIIIIQVYTAERK